MTDTGYTRLAEAVRGAMTEGGPWCKEPTEEAQLIAFVQHLTDNRRVDGLRQAADRIHDEVTVVSGRYGCTDAQDGPGLGRAWRILNELTEAHTRA